MEKLILSLIGFALQIFCAWYFSHLIEGEANSRLAFGVIYFLLAISANTSRKK